MLANLVLLAAFQGIVNAPVVINEFVYDDSGTDDREFVELYNRSNQTVDISGWVLDSEDPTGPNTKYTIPANTLLKASGFWVIGSSNLAGVDQKVGTQDLWENDNESLTLRNGNVVVDTLVYEANKGLWASAAKLVEGQGIWGNLVSIDNFETSWSRIRDGYDTNNNRDFVMMPATPGKPNNPYLPLPYIENYDKLVVSAPLPRWQGSFKNPTVIDPTKADTFNPNPIPASPQGGNAAIMWDPSGGGNASTFLHSGLMDVVVEAYVYFDATPRGTGEYENWAMGVQGTTATYFNHPDPANLWNFIDNGNTGVSWIFQRTDKNAILYLIDHNEGGWGQNAKIKPKILGSITLTPKQNDGWQRLRLQVTGDLVEGWFGGTYGCGDGIHVAGKIQQPALATVYLGYRERINNNSTTRPFTFDRMTILSGTSHVAHYGTATKSTVGTPAISTFGTPLIGFGGFAILGSNLVPQGASIVVLGTQQASIPLPGGPPGLTLLTIPVAVAAQLNTAQGTSKLPVPLPCNANLITAALQWQILDIDPKLSVPLPLANSQGMTTTIY